MSFPLCHHPQLSLTVFSCWLLFPHASHVDTEYVKSRDVAVPVRAKLLAAGGATCACHFSQSICCPRMFCFGELEVTHYGGSSGLVKRGHFGGSSVRTGYKVGFQIVSNPFFLSQPSTGAKAHQEISELNFSL